MAFADQSARLLRTLDKLGKIGRDGVRAELLATPADADPGAVLQPEQVDPILDFVDLGRGPVAVLDRVAPLLDDQPAGLAAVEQLRELFRLIVAGGVPSDRLRVDVGLARGLDYYTGMVLETTVDGWEKFGSVASGGRYDNLTRLFTDQPLPGVGASIGLDRLLALFDEAGLLKGPATAVPVLVVNFAGVDPAGPVALGRRLRAAGIGAEVYPDPIQTGKQLQYGSTRGHRFAVIVGPDEHAAGTFNLRDLATRTEQKGCPLGDLETTLRAAVDQPKVEAAR